MPRHPEHLSGFDYIGPHRYFLTFCTAGRQHAFEVADVVNGVLLQIQRAAERRSFDVLAYCFMPDHVHLLIEGTSEVSEARSFIALAKQLSGYWYARAHPGPLWQRYGYERVLRNDQDTIAITRYIIENPIRAGLVRSVGDYPFVGSCRYTIEQVVEAVMMTPKWRRGRSG